VPLSAGDTLDRYEILAPIGKGGMGEVYRARDPRLNRDVAIKVSAVQFNERFEREGKAIAALNHTNICQVFDVGASPAGQGYLVMEYIEGKSLDDLIKEATKPGPMPLAEALRIAKQIAIALEDAHDKGIIHRDLKPANIKIKPDGTVKVLDFGLAKVAFPFTPPGDDAATLTMGLTQAGMVMGTPAYMAPEQARGKENVDKRADIWAFGVVLYEMVTGRRLFQGENLGHTLASVIMQEPDLSGAPAEVQPLLKRCLEKDPKKRLRDIGDAWDLVVENTDPSPPRHGAESRFGWVGWSMAGLLATALAAVSFIHFREVPAEERLVTTTILPPDNSIFSFSTDNNPPAISPDGLRIVFGVRTGAQSQLWVRSLDSGVAQPLAGTENAQFPFWSPDNKSIAFFADGKLKRIEVVGGPALTIADAPLPRGGAWSPGGVIVFSPTTPGGLLRVAADGGTISPATTLASTNDRSHRFPWFLPDGRHFLFEDQLQLGNNDEVLRVASLDSTEVKSLGPANSNVVYAQGHLLFLRERRLMAQPFDTNQLATIGEAMPIGEGVQTALPAGSVGAFSVSRVGLLAYQSGASGGAQLLTWFERNGRRGETLGDAGEFRAIEFSPDRKSVAVTLLVPNVDLWIYEVARGLKTRFTFEPTQGTDAIWSPDGKKIIFSSSQEGHHDLFRKSADLTGTEEVLYADGSTKTPRSWSGDGKFLLFSRVDSKMPSDIWVLPMTDAAGAKPFPFLQTPFGEGQAKFSPDGKSVAYVSNESQQREVYVAPFPGPGGKRQISTGGGNNPRWRADGKELFYTTLNGSLMAAEVASKGSIIEVGAVHSLGISVVTSRGYLYDVSADGQRFLVASAPEQKTSAPLTVVSNWTKLMKK
jgi:serine/threonine protein kinase